ncbi:cysteine proteinase [Daldinia vernicosa]|uniref:cysteine proteinase n=1 Tax=Daldinia vernicosa TaxID=114800 RepID=UPI002008E985|nr:cysteine proteinase [Daldinia vernicosa]KAI0852173.1 cysteine proteinase [Daldinia vernicosa]
MRSHPSKAQPDRLNNDYTYYVPDILLERLQQPSVLVPLLLLLFTIFYQYLHSSPFSRPRHPGELLWDFIVTITPATVLYALDGWLHPPTFPTPGSMSSTQPRSHATKSELLRRILGMDGPGGIITSVADAGRRRLSSLSSSTLVKHKTDQPPGLGNYDNSCFQNSILQGLSSLRPFPLYLARGLEQDGSDSDEELGSASSLRDLISKLTGNNYNGKTLWTPKKLKSLDTWQQQDAQEYFSKILDEVEKEIMKTVKPTPHSPGFEVAGIRDDTEDSQHSDDSGYQSLPVLSKAGSDARLLRNPLEGLLAQRVACVQCGYSDGLSMTPFNCLTLNLGLEQTEHDLYERLDSYTDLETIEGVECAKCTLLSYRKLLKILQSRRGNDATETELRKLNSRLEVVELALEEDDFQETTLKDKCEIRKRVSSTKTKQVAIARPPQSLAIHMNRSVFDENTGQMFKNLAAVRFPKTLDLGPWCLGSAGGPAGLIQGRMDSTASASDDEEQWVTDPKSSMVSGDIKPSRISGPLYELRAVITHQGRHENGHYVCYRRHPCKPSKLEDEESDSGIGSDNTAGDESTLADGVDGDDGECTGSTTDAKWWRLSDESVWEVSEETVLAQGGVFMLFYDCIDPNSVLVSTIQHETEQTEPDSSIFTPFGGQDIDNTAEAGNTEGLEDKPLESGEQAHDIPSTEELSGLVRTNDITSPLSDDNPGVEIDSTQPPKTRPLGSILTPLLKDGERVDPIIPLCRPNS